MSTVPSLSKPASVLPGAVLDANSLQNLSEFFIDIDPVPPVDPESTNENNENDEGGTFSSLSVRVSKYIAFEYAKSLSQAHIQAWVDVRRQRWLEELIRMDGIQLSAPCQCGMQEGVLRCRECLNGDLLCSGCMVATHQNLPLHHIEKWTGTHFERAWLRDHGLVVQLGHRPGETCSSPIPAHSKFTVVHSNGPHVVKLLFCGCTAVDQDIQLLRTKWMPATWQSPRTAITFDYLKTFHLLSLTAKTSLWDYYQVVQFKGDNAGLHPMKYYRPAVSFATRVWRHLKSLHWGGSVYIPLPEGVRSTPRGALTVACPPCPHPGINLPPDWDKKPPDQIWLYALFLAIDANFKLKLKDRSIQDVRFGSGWSYFVDSEEYLKHVGKATDAQEVSQCGSHHNAVQQALTRGNSKTIATGIAGVICSRHAMILPNGVGDLQKGERYANIDFILASVIALVGKDIQTVNILYDIMCAYSVNMRARFALLPLLLIIPWFLVIRAFIPKLHIYDHGLACQTKFSLNVNRGVARTHGETIEQIWAYLGIAATSTREMGPGLREMVLTDMMGGSNFRKRVNLGHHFATHLPEAVQLRDAYQELADDFSATFPSEVVAKWRAMVVAWQRDHSQPDPFAEPEKANNMDALREELLTEEAAIPVNPLQKVSASEFIKMGLDLEEKQRGIRVRVATTSQRTASQRISVQQLQTSLRHGLNQFFKVQATYMPTCRNVRDVLDGDNASQSEDNGTLADHLPENVPLLLPSSIKAEVRKAVCLSDIINIERRMRIAQAEDALADLRRLRRVYQGLHARLRKNVYGVGQSTNTRSRAILNAFLDKIKTQKNRYRAAFNALSSLDPGGPWTSYLKELKDADVSGPGKDEEDEIEERVRGQQQYMKSWIWTTPVPNTRPVSAESMSETELNEQIRAEWAKTDARAARWSEEVELLVEEMRRTLVWLDWKADWWLTQPARREDVSSDVKAGLDGCANKQAAILRQQLRNFASTWVPTLLELNLGRDWVGPY
ncbi:hypothetical protein PUNSTDRAFT_68926, partial [Punctularia strigosozonata HHB-11173 SS5]|uniref:uncharacterized protein n=1 Tax=Punctularia strigosozonata (strain HHB-11173) TaxID=741275 RepID=UPI0004417F51